jgi:hypothetical protein
LAEGYRIGIVAGSDGHKGRPGASYPGASKFGSYGGLTCHLMPELSRDALFSAFRKRRHYATTGCRAFIDLRLNDFGGGQRILPDGVEDVTEGLIGDILAARGPGMTLSLHLAGHAGIERIEIRDGLQVLEIIKPQGPDPRQGNRLRIQCEGAEYKGRGRLVTWNVTANVHGAEIRDLHPINFWNPDRLPEWNGSRAQWSNVTTGGLHAVDLWFDDISQAQVVVESEAGSLCVNAADMLDDELALDCGGLGKRISVLRLPDAQLPAQIELSRTIDLPLETERRLYVKVMFEDGHMAWTSPIYIRRH